jgi:Sec7-like guanine-nucleotide exchange factor
MHVGLPRETQQIDRVIEAFAFRYSQCNLDLFGPHGKLPVFQMHKRALTGLPDHTYILAFSLIMLHTDAFNKSNKRKMSKADYLKNTSLPGIAPEVLDVRH